ncbi:hypothetical protein ACFLYQ_02905 [Chloroflexota bacterium]
MADTQSGNKGYRVVQIEDKITWRVEELWDGGITRGPYGSKDAAINAEETIARNDGFIDDLVLEKVEGREVSPSQAFEKDENGNWLCLEGCSIEMNNKEIVFAKGTTFTEGSSYMGVDVAKWLEENS